MGSKVTFSAVRRQGVGSKVTECCYAVMRQGVGSKVTFSAVRRQGVGSKVTAVLLGGRVWDLK